MQGALPTLWLAWSGAAFAQEPPPFQVPAFEATYQGDWGWTPIGPLTDGMSDVAIDPSAPGRWAAITPSGAVWTSVDGGASWVLALAALNVASTGGGPVQQDVGSLLEDVIGDIDLEAVGDAEAYDDSETLEEAAGQVQQAIEEIDDLTNEDGVSADAPTDPGRRARPRVWFDGGILYAGRDDGLHRSIDGSGWTQVIGQGTRALIRTARGLVAGTDDGMRYAGDGWEFFDSVDGSEGIEVLALAPVGELGGLLAGTVDGVWASEDGSAWLPLAPFGEAALEVAVDPDIPGRVWVGLSGGLRASEDGGRTFTTPLTAPMPGVTRLLRVGALHWLAVSADGPWESLNGGLTWLPLSRGLADPDTWGLEALGGAVVLASEEGLFRLDRLPDLIVDPDAQASLFRDELASWVPRDDLIGSALGRREFQIRPGDPRLATALPRVTLRGEYRSIDGLAYSSGLDADEAVLDDSAGTIRIIDQFWSAVVELRWAPAGRKNAALGDSFSNASEADFGVSLDGLDGSDSDDGVERAASVYAQETARRVGELYTARAEALQRRATVARAPLLQQVQLELHIAELEAHLDTLTDGAVSAWTRGATPSRRSR